VLNPAGVQEILDYGLYGWALSRYSGCWTALKLIAETVDSSASIVVASERLAFTIPGDFDMPADGLSIRWPDSPQEQERRLHNFKLPAALAFARSNRLDRVAIGGPRRRLGIVTTGKSYLDVRQALDELGISEKRAIELGLSVYKVGMVWPLEPESIAAFAAGLEELLIVEEKRPLIEGQVKDILYNMPADRRPRIFGKRDGENRIVLPAHDDLTAIQIARAIAARILPWLEDRDLVERISRLADVDGAKLASLAPVQRTPYFCSGCPHNTSTRVPDGSRALAGIGCHWMSQAMERNTATYTHMGGEGANWIGQAPYVPTRHVFQNLGDGTYFHSGLLAIRASGKYEKSDGYIKNINPVGGGNDSEYYTYRIQGRLTPTPNLTLDVTYNYSDETLGMRNGVPTGFVTSTWASVYYGKTSGMIGNPDGVGFFPTNDNRVNFNRPQRVGSTFEYLSGRAVWDIGTVSVTGVSDGLDGASRPGHFDGVATVVSKLFNQVRPDFALFGEKDYQQLAVIRRMVDDLDMDIEIVGVPTQRDEDGLALSSRNIYLTEPEREAARMLPRALGEAARAISGGTPVAAALERAEAALARAGFDPIDYVALCDAETLQPVDSLERPARLMAAARIGGTRLIDNLAVEAEPVAQ